MASDQHVTTRQPVDQVIVRPAFQTVCSVGSRHSVRGQKYIILNAIHICVAHDDVAKLGRCDLVQDALIDLCVNRAKAFVGGPCTFELVGHDVSKRHAQLGALNVILGQSTNPKINLVNCSIGGFKTGLGIRVACDDGKVRQVHRFGVDIPQQSRAHVDIAVQPVIPRAQDVQRCEGKAPHAVVGFQKEVQVIDNHCINLLRHIGRLPAQDHFDAFCHNSIDVEEIALKRNIFHRRSVFHHLAHFAADKRMTKPEPCGRKLGRNPSVCVRVKGIVVANGVSDQMGHPILIGDFLDFSFDDRPCGLKDTLIRPIGMLRRQAVGPVVVFTGEKGVQRCKPRIFVRAHIAGQKHFFAAVCASHTGIDQWHKPVFGHRQATPFKAAQLGLTCVIRAINHAGIHSCGDDVFVHAWAIDAAIRIV